MPRYYVVYQQTPEVNGNNYCLYKVTNGKALHVLEKYTPENYVRRISRSEAKRLADRWRRAWNKKAPHGDPVIIAKNLNCEELA